MFIRLENVYYSYFQHTPFEVQALKNVTLTIDRGESVGTVSYTHLDVYKRQVHCKRLVWS